jgi:hypothetical protein
MGWTDGGSIVCDFLLELIKVHMSDLHSVALSFIYCTCNCGMQVMKGNGKRGLDDNNHGEPSKRHKADLQGSQVKLNKVSVGYDHNVNDRFSVC